MNLMKRCFKGVYRKHRMNVLCVFLKKEPNSGRLWGLKKRLKGKLSFAKFHGFRKHGQGHTLYFLHLNDLRDLKVIAQRPKDLRDVIMIDDFLKFQQINNEPTD